MYNSISRPRGVVLLQRDAGAGVPNQRSGPTPANVLQAQLQPPARLVRARRIGLCPQPIPTSSRTSERRRAAGHLDIRPRRHVPLRVEDEPQHLQRERPSRAPSAAWGRGWRTAARPRGPPARERHLRRPAAAGAAWPRCAPPSGPAQPRTSSANMPPDLDAFPRRRHGGRRVVLHAYLRAMPSARQQQRHPVNLCETAGGPSFLELHHPLLLLLRQLSPPRLPAQLAELIERLRTHTHTHLHWLLVVPPPGPDASGADQLQEVSGRSGGRPRPRAELSRSEHGAEIRHSVPENRSHRRR